ncbi:MAG: hypothetical protein ACTSVU_01060 [Promethearchaeota archaeon]
MKTPSEFGQRMARLNADLHQSKKNNYEILGNVISELLAIFPNALPKDILLSKANEFDISDEFCEGIFEKMSEAGLLLINKDRIADSNKTVFKFPSLPIKFGKLFIQKPSSSQRFQRKKW